MSQDDELTVAEAAARIAALRAHLHSREDLTADEAARVRGTATGLDIALALLARTPEARDVLGDQVPETAPDLADVIDLQSRRER